MNVISVLIGIVALIAALVAFIPLLGWLNWLVIPVVAIGLVIGLFSSKTTGRNINLAVWVVRCGNSHCWAIAKSVAVSGPTTATQHCANISEGRA